MNEIFLDMILRRCVNIHFVEHFNLCKKMYTLINPALVKVTKSQLRKMYKCTLNDLCYYFAFCTSCTNTVIMEISVLIADIQFDAYE